MLAVGYFLFRNYNLQFRSLMYLTICCRDFTLCKSVFTLRLPCGRAVLHEVRPYSGWWAARCGRSWAGEGLCRGENDEGEILGKCGGSKGKQKSRKAVGLAGRELYFAE